MSTLYFVLTTGRCNLRCRYCGGSFPEKSVPWSIKYDLHMLKQLIERDSDATVAFYGGEPLLNHGFIEEVMDTVTAKRFVIQTNGLLVKELGWSYWNKMDSVLLSIDGTKKTTDFYRGRGIYERVTETARSLRSNGFKGDLIARMAVSERSDIFNDVTHLLGLRIFDHIHWQLDAGWSDAWNDFGAWCDGVYKPGIMKLSTNWLSELEMGRVQGLVPFLGILRRIRRGGPIPPCGSGTESLSIMPDGSIRACPISFDAGWALVGRLSALPLSEFPKVHIAGSRGCDSCSYLRVCGGRCLYFNRESLWSSKGFAKVCEVTKFTIDRIAAMESSVNKAVAGRLIDPNELDYPKFNNSTEIIP